MTYEQAFEEAKRPTEAGFLTRVHWSRAHPERVRRVEQINAATLTEHGVREIRVRYAVGATACELGRRYGVTTTMIAYIVKHRNWKHVA